MIYLGSKNRLSKHLKPIIESYIDENTQAYIEPFVGGGNMIDKIEVPPGVRRIGYDVDKYCIAVLQGLRDGRLPLLEVSKELYDHVKQNKEEYDDFTVGYIGYELSFGSKFFAGYAKRDDRKKRGDVYSWKHCMAQADRLRDIEFAVKDFRDLEEVKGCVIYCDPPYRGTTEYKGVPPFPYEEFYDWCRRMSKDNTVLVSEYDMPEDFEVVWEKPIKVTLEATDNGKKRVEKLWRLKQ